MFRFIYDVKGPKVSFANVGTQRIRYEKLHHWTDDYPWKDDEGDGDLALMSDTHTICSSDLGVDLFGSLVRVRPRHSGCILSWKRERKRLIGALL
ncbi:hypothetical protein BDN67DRAFT_970744 [Paxillus ammoniavirescens]|nr:hypothetical protein BDN67DRAFT_970744 [Paxillus ammoniavirescens]